MITPARAVSIGLLLPGLWLVLASPAKHDPKHPLVIPVTRSVTVRATEGTGLAFDITPDGRSIIFDLLGQLWSLPVVGGTATPLTNSVRDTSDDADPSVSPDGMWVVFRSDRPQGRGLWLLSLSNGQLRPLTRDAYFANNEHWMASWAPDSLRIVYGAKRQLRTYNILTNEDQDLRVSGVPPFLTDPTWSADGKKVLAVGGLFGGRLLEIDVAARKATPVRGVEIDVRGPRFSPDGQRLAFFTEGSNSQSIQLWVTQQGMSRPRIVVEDRDLSPLRVRWAPDGESVFYVAGGKLWRVSSDGGTPAQISFSATVRFDRLEARHPLALVPKPGQVFAARGFAGLAIAPDARRYAILALGKLWVSEIHGQPRAVASVPSTASGLSWSPDGSSVAWSAGPGGAENIFVTQINTRETHQLTALPGSESLATWSPDGNLLAFVHWAKPESADVPWAPDQTGLRIRVVDAKRSSPAALADTRDWGPFHRGYLGTDRLNWNAWSTAVLAFDDRGWPIANDLPARAFWRGQDELETPLSDLPYRPSFLHVAGSGTLTYIQDGLLWRKGLGAAPAQLTSRVALHPSVAENGTVLYVSDDGLRLHQTDGIESVIGWPLKQRVPAAPAPLLLRNVHIFDRPAAPTGALQDVLISDGRIVRIAPAHVLRPPAGATEIDAAGRTVIPGLIDAHAHLSDPAVLPASLYYGVTTVRDMGSPIARAAGYRDSIQAGVVSGSRVLLGGLRFFPAPTTGGLSSDEEWMPKDTASMQRGLAVLRAFGGAHVKMVFPLTFAAGAEFTRMSVSAGFTISGHCAQPLPLIAAGITDQEHLDGQCRGRSNPAVHQDRIELYRNAKLWGVSTIHQYEARVRASHEFSTHPEPLPFLTPRLRLQRFGSPPTDESDRLLKRQGDATRLGTTLLHAGQIPIAAGADAPDFPDALPGELEDLVSSGFSPMDALQAATFEAARMMGIDADVGSISVGKCADLVLLDGDPVADISNVRRVWRVIQSGRLVDRDRLAAEVQQGR